MSGLQPFVRRTGAGPDKVLVNFFRAYVRRLEAVIPSWPAQ
jgi:hypothetical protein